MAVFRRGYQRYTGPLIKPWQRLLVIPRFVWPRLLSQRFVVVLLVVSLFWPLACSVFVYFSNHLDLLQNNGGGAIAKVLVINGAFFSVFMNVQSTFAMILAAVAGPGLIAPDLVNNALPLYFARPLSRWTYILARMIVLLGILSLVTLIPGLFVFGMQASMAGWDWFVAHWTYGMGIVLGFLLWMVTVSLVALTSSAYVKWRVVAGALVLAFFFVLTGVGQIVNQVMRVQRGSLLSPGYLMLTIWGRLLGVETPWEGGPDAFECMLALLVLIGVLLAVLVRKLRPVEVVS